MPPPNSAMRKKMRICGERQCPAGRRAGEPEATYRDEDEDGVERVQQGLPAALRRGSRPEGVDAGAAAGGGRVQHEAGAVEDDHQAQEADDEELLETQPDEVDLEADLDGVGVAAGAGHDAARALDDEGEDVGEHKPLAHAPGADGADLLGGQVEEDHARQRHVDEGVDPQRRQQVQDGVRGGEADVLLVLGAQGVQDEAERLPHGAHDEHPGVALLEDEGLDDVGGRQQAEEHRHGDGRLGQGVEVVVAVAGAGGDVAVLARRHGDAALREVLGRGRDRRRGGRRRDAGARRCRHLQVPRGGRVCWIVSLGLGACEVGDR